MTADFFHACPDLTAGKPRCECFDDLNAGVWKKLEATPGFNEAMETGVAQIAEGKSHPLHPSKKS